MNEKLFSKYASEINKLINNKYCLNSYSYNLNDYELEEIDFKLWDFYYKDGQSCKVLDYQWGYYGRWSCPDNFKIILENNTILTDIKSSDLYMTPDTLEKYGWCFSREDY